MGILNIWLAYLVAGLGLPVGYIIARMTKEEMDVGIKFFKVLIPVTAGLLIGVIFLRFFIVFDYFLYTAILIFLLGLFIGSFYYVKRPNLFSRK